MKTFLNRRQLLIGAGMGAVGTATAVGTAPAPVFPAEDTEQVEGGWYVTVQVVEPSPATFDALYGFA